MSTPQHPKLTTDEKNLIRFLELHGGITELTGTREGWLKQSQPVGPLRTLIDKRIVAPKILTSFPLRAVFVLRRAHNTIDGNQAIEKEQERLKLKEGATDNWLKHAARETLKNS